MVACCIGVGASSIGIDKVLKAVWLGVFLGSDKKHMLKEVSQALPIIRVI